MDLILRDFGTTDVKAQGTRHKVQGTRYKPRHKAQGTRIRYKKPETRNQKQETRNKKQETTRKKDKVLRIRSGSGEPDFFLVTFITRMRGRELHKCRIANYANQETRMTRIRECE